MEISTRVSWCCRSAERIAGLALAHFRPDVIRMDVDAGTSSCLAPDVDATHLYCANCRAIRPVEFERLLASEPSLGTAARCARCSWLALTMIGPARVYCDVCDEIRPAVLHEYRPAGLLSGGLVRCAVCYASRARLYGTKVSAAKG